MDATRNGVKNKAGTRRWRRASPLGGEGGGFLYTRLRRRSITPNPSRGTAKDSKTGGLRRSHLTDTGKIRVAGSVDPIKQVILAPAESWCLKNYWRWSRDRGFGR